MPAIANKTAIRPRTLILLVFLCFYAGCPLSLQAGQAQNRPRVMRVMNAEPPRLLDIYTGVLAQAEPLGVVAPPAPKVLPAPVIVPVSLEVKSSDDLGHELAEKLRQKIQDRPDLHLDHPGRHLRLILHTSSEDVDRPQAGSIYSLVLLHKIAEDGLPFFLDMQTGLLMPGRVDNVAELLMEKCMGIVRKYQESRSSGR